ACGQQRVPAPNATMAKGKIVGGNQAWPGAWPWLVSVRLNGELMCGGVLVEEAWVLTAAHCFTGSKNELAWSVVVGDYDVTKPDEGERAVPVSRILSHPKRPTELNPGMLCYIIGWGSLYEDGPAADVVMEARVPILSQDICRGTLGSQLFTSAMFCAGYLSGGIDSCQVAAPGAAMMAAGGGGGEERDEGKRLQPSARKMEKREARTTHRRAPRSVFPSFASLFQDTGPNLVDWVQALSAMAEGPRTPTTGEEQLFLQVEELQAQGRVFLQQLLQREFHPDTEFPDARSEEGAVTQAVTANGSVARDAHPLRKKRSFRAGPIEHSDNTLPQGSGCHGLNESAQRVTSAQELYHWILQVPPQELNMTFQEILVDLTSKNAKGLYRARIQAHVGHQVTAFTGLIGLETESMYRSMPGLIALALDSLKT
ncbi:hypothetical protein JRQ81_017693, partial [Phrynocephalus forsythii]